MAELASLVVEVESRGARQTASDLDRLTVSADKAADEVARLDNAGRSGAAGLERLNTVSRNVEQNTARAARGLAGVGRAANQNANSFGLMGHQTANLAQQFQDLVVQIGSGQSAFTALLQQGPQITSAMGGVSNSVNILGQALSRIGPIALTAFAGVGAAAAAAFSAISSDNTRREIENLTDQFRIIENQFGRGLNADQAEEAMRGVMDMAQRTGISIKTLANAQRDLMAAGLKGGSLGRDSGFGFDPEALETFLDLLKRTGTEFDATGDLAEKFFADMRKGSLDQKTLNELMAQSPKFARAFIDALGGYGRVQQQFQSGVGVSARQSMSALQGVATQLQGMQRVIPSVGSAWSEAAGKASAAATKFQLALAPNSRGIAEGIASALLKVGDMFERAGMNAEGAAARLREFMKETGFDRLVSEGLRFGGIIVDIADHWGKVARAQFDALGGFPGLINAGKEFAGIVVSIADGFGKKAREGVDAMLGAVDRLIAKTADWLNTTGVPSFIQSSLSAIEGLIGKLGELVRAAEAAAVKASSMTTAQKREAMDGGQPSGLGASPVDYFETRDGRQIPFNDPRNYNSPGEGMLGQGSAYDGSYGPPMQPIQTKLVRDPGDRGEPIYGGLQNAFRDLIQKNEDQLKATQDGTAAAEAGSAAQKAAADAAKANLDATARFGTMQVDAVLKAGDQNVRVWSLGNDKVGGGVEKNTASTRSGLSAVEAAIRSMGRGGGGMGGGGGRGSASVQNFRVNSKSPITGYDTSSDFDNAEEAQSYANYLQRGVDTSWQGTRGTYQVGPEGVSYGIMSPLGGGTGTMFDMSGVGFHRAPGAWATQGSRFGGGHLLGNGSGGGVAPVTREAFDAYKQGGMAETDAQLASSLSTFARSQFAGGAANTNNRNILRGDDGRPVMDDPRGPRYDPGGDRAGWGPAAGSDMDSKNPAKFYAVDEYAKDWGKINEWYGGGSGGDAGQQLLQATAALPAAIGQEVAAALEPMIANILRGMSGPSSHNTFGMPLHNRTAPVPVAA